METGSFQKLAGEIEADETFIGGLAKNMHKKVREAKINGRGPMDKTVVMGVLQRDGEVRAFVVPDRKKPTVQAKVRENVTPGSEVFTDALRSYEGLTPEYAHEAVDHAECYVRGNVHTNGLENFWSLLKRTLGGTYVAVAPFHLHRYVNEQVFRFNARYGRRPVPRRRGEHDRPSLDLQGSDRGKRGVDRCPYHPSARKKNL
jgi:transposase-like protein